MKVQAKTPAGRILETDYTPLSQFVALKLSLGMGLGFPDKLDPDQARMLAAGLIANADKAEAARAAAGVTL